MICMSLLPEICITLLINYVYDIALIADSYYGL